MHRVLIFSLLLPLAHRAQADEWRTKYEASGFVETSRYDETVTFCRRLADACSFAEYRSFGESAEGRELPLLWIDKYKKSDAPLFFIIAGIHSGEIDGKDAGLTLFRDALIFDKYPGLMDSIRIAFVPIFNVDGHERFSKYSRSNQIGPKEMGWRTTATAVTVPVSFTSTHSPPSEPSISEYPTGGTTTPCPATRWPQIFFCSLRPARKRPTIGPVECLYGNSITCLA